jgi:hypothetical protein
MVQGCPEKHESLSKNKNQQVKQKKKGLQELEKEKRLVQEELT